MLQNNSLPINIKNWWENERKKTVYISKLYSYSPWGQDKLSNRLKTGSEGGEEINYWLWFLESEYFQVR